MDEISLRSGLILKAPEWMIKHFVAEEYHKYDCLEVCQDSTLSEVEIQLPNRIHGRFRKEGQEGLWKKRASIEAALSQVPKCLGLCEADDALWPTMKKLLETMCTVRWVGLAVATKLLHKKRPWLIPVMDSVIQKHYTGAWRKGYRPIFSPQVLPSSDDRAKLGVWVMRYFREDLLGCEAQIKELSAMLEERGAPLTPVRVLEVLIWMEEEEDDQGNGHYRRQRDWLMGE